MEFDRHLDLLSMDHVRGALHPITDGAQLDDIQGAWEAVFK